MNLVIMILCTTMVAQEAFAANILALLPLDIGSHQMFCQPILRELANRGHQLTILTPIQDQKAPKNVKTVLLPKMPIAEILKGMEDYKINYFKDEPMSVHTNHLLVWNVSLQMSERVMKSKAFQNFLANDKTKYDLVIYESFYHDAFIVLAAKYNAPFVAISTFGHAHFINQFMGNPYEISYTGHEFLGLTGKLKFIDRVKNFYTTGYELWSRWRYLLPLNQELAKTYSLVPMDKLPGIRSVENNVSLVLTNSHFSMYGVRPVLPNIVEVGGIHIDDSKELPTDMKKFMDDARDGVIYISFGTTVRSNIMPHEVLQMFLEIFANLKQRVIWKWDDAHIKGLPKNVMISNWVPQVAVLGHPNMKIFINQGGGLSMQESVSKAVPVICIPLYGDQFGNCARAKHAGYGEHLVANQLNKDDLENAIHNILSENTYKENAIRVSSIYHDRPMSPIETAMYWIEYVIRHKGAPHLSSPAREYYWYEYYSIDVVLLFVLIIYYTWFILNWLFWNVAMRKPINRDHLIELRQQHMPKVPMKED